MQRVDPYGLVGQILDGQFRVDAPIGEGGCSVVYKGHHVGLDAPVAIKCLKLQQQLGTAFVQSFEQRFRDESKIQYRLSQGSLHIVRTLGAGTTITPGTSALIPYMVLEWLEGFTLAEQLQARQERGERGRPLTEVVRMLDPVAEAMAFAHSLGVVHRDLNPSNLFVVVLPDGTQRLKVVDFGVAKVLSDNALQLLNRAATLGSLRMFTPVYGAPEQFSETFGKISPATDVYAFALLVVELLLDRSPVEGDNLTDLMMKATDTVLRPTPWSLGCTTVGESVEIAMTRALHVDPTKRHADIGAFWGALKHAMSQDEELSKRRASQPPAALSAPGPKTKKGTLIIRPEANTFADAPSTSSIFAEGSTSSRAVFPESSTASGPRGTLQMQVYSGGEPGSSERPPGSSDRQPGSSGVGERPVTIRPPTTGAEADPLGQTQSGAPRRGASPLSFTMQPGQDLFSPEQRALVEQQEAQRNAPSTPPPTLNATLSSGSAGNRTSERPVAPELAVTPSSVPRWLLVVLGLGGLGALVAGGWVVSRMLAP